MNRAISCIGGSAAKNDWITAKGRLLVIDVALAVAPPLPLVRYLTAVEETKFGKAAILLVERLGAAVCMHPSLLERNAGMRQRTLAAKLINGHAYRTVSSPFHLHVTRQD